jgi:hypothetical protein
LGLVLSIGSIDLTIAVGTTNTSLFLLRHVSTKWLILPQFVQVNVDLVVTVGTTSLTLALTFGVVKYCNSYEQIHFPYIHKGNFVMIN